MGFVKGDSMAVGRVNKGTIALSLIQFYLQYSHLLIHGSIMNPLCPATCKTHQRVNNISLNGIGIGFPFPNSCLIEVKCLSVLDGVKMWSQQCLPSRNVMSAAVAIFARVSV
jgi:hypothetical protein